MAEGDDDSSSSSSVSSCASLNAENYSQLLQAFKETHEEANRLALLNNQLKELNNWLENRVQTLEEELEKSKFNFENLQMHCKIFSYLCDSKVCENCKTLESKVHYLVRTVDKISKGKSNFEIVLASQKCVFGKSGLEFNPQIKKNGISKHFSKVPEKQPIERSKQPVVTCFYCMKRCRLVRLCKSRKYSIPKGIMRWIPKGSDALIDKAE